MTTEVNIGDRVYWNDPDDGLCSGYGEVITLTSSFEDAIAVLQMEDGGEVEALLSELEVMQ